EGLLPAPFKRPVYLCIDRAVDYILLLLQRLYDAPDAVSNARWSLARSLPLGDAAQANASAASRSTRIMRMVLMVGMRGGPSRLGTSPPVKPEGATCAPLV
ncbi:hypothetical protein ASF33_17060, partial [Methylobacterium sp. Leaf92]